MLRSLVAWALGLASGIFVFSIALGITRSTPIGCVVAIAAVALVGWVFTRRPVLSLDPTACSRSIKIVAIVATLLALGQLGRLAVFMADSSKTAYSIVPSSKWEVGHSCLSAYYVSARAADTVPNIYADSLFTSRDDDPTKVRKALKIGRFNIDVYEYPPPFLLLPRALRLLVPEFEPFRALWFGLNGVVILIATLVLARAMGPTFGTRALLLSPLLLAAPSTLSTLQKGNVQAVVISLAAIAMALFEGRRWMRGGLLLAYAIVSKLYPGLLIVYLLLKRQWRAVVWTAAFCLALAVITWLDLGWAAYRAFVGHLPGLLGGEAFPAFRNPMATAINFSVPGLVFKLKLFGVPGMGFPVAKLVGWIYTVIALGVVAWVARREVDKERLPLIWLAIIILATLRSPFLPQAYAAVPAVLLLVLLSATRSFTPGTAAIVVLAWLALAIGWPTDWPMDPRLVALLLTIPQAVTIALTIVALRETRPVPHA